MSICFSKNSLIELVIEHRDKFESWVSKSGNNSTASKSVDVTVKTTKTYSGQIIKLLRCQTLQNLKLKHYFEKDIEIWIRRWHIMHDRPKPGPGGSRETNAQPAARKCFEWFIYLLKNNCCTCEDCAKLLPMLKNSAKKDEICATCLCGSDEHLDIKCGCHIFVDGEELCLEQRECSACKIQFPNCQFSTFMQFLYEEVCDDDIEKVIAIHLALCNRCMQKKSLSENHISRCLRGSTHTEQLIGRKGMMPQCGHEVRDALIKCPNDSKSERIALCRNVTKTADSIKRSMRKIFKKKIKKAIEMAKKGNVDKEIVKTAVATIENKPKKRKQVVVYKTTASLCRKRTKQR